MGFERLKLGEIGLVQETEDGKIIQIGLTTAHSKLLQIFLASLSQEHPLVQMGEDYELILKSDVCKRCKNKKK